LVGSEKQPASIFQDKKYGDRGRNSVDIYRGKTGIGAIIDVSGNILPPSSGKNIRPSSKNGTAIGTGAPREPI
jgi:hypothetical protein